jgi:hypothetical protein
VLMNGGIYYRGACLLGADQDIIGLLDAVGWGVLWV